MDLDSTIDRPARTRTLGACGPAPHPVAIATPAAAPRDLAPASAAARVAGFGFALASYAIFFATFPSPGSSKTMK